MAEPLDLEGKIKLAGPNYGGAENDNVTSPIQQAGEKSVPNTLDEPVVETIVKFLNLFINFTHFFPIEKRSKNDSI